MKINRININTYNKNFKGYTNVYGSNMYITDGSRFNFISMQLNNDKKEDLKEYINIRRMMNVPKEEADIPLLTFSNFFDSLNEKKPKKECLYLNDKYIYSGEELAQRQTNDGKTIPSYLYKQEEKIHLRLYTFLADLTKRIMQDSYFERNELINALRLHNFMSFARFVPNIELPLKLEHVAFENNVVPYQKVAEGLNEKIASTMKDFFRY